MTTRQKYSVLALIWLVLLVSHLDRTNITVAAPTMMRELGFTPAQFGIVLSSFLIGYALTQIPGGYLSDRLGARTILISSLILWSFFTGLTGFVTSLPWLISIRLLFGACEGFSIGPAFKLIGDYFSPKERPFVNSVYLSAIAIGPALVTPLATWCLKHVGWQAMFGLFTIPGLVVAWLLQRWLPRSTPEQDDKVPSLISLDHAVKPRSKHWLILAYLGFNIAFWGYLGWIPSYLSHERHLTASELGFAVSIPYTFGVFGLLGLGLLSSRLGYRRRGSLLAAVYSAAAISLLSAYLIPGTVNCVIFLSFSAFLLYGSLGSVWSLILDLSPSQTRGTFSGTASFFGQIGSIIALLAIGFAVEHTGQYAGGFAFMITGLIIASLATIIFQCSVRLQKKARAAR